MKTICLVCKSKGDEKWYPAPVTVLEKIISRRIDGIWRTHPEGMPMYYSPGNPNYGIAKNLAYNFQYIECLAFQLQTLALSDVLYVQTVKTFIMHVGAVFEAILKYEVKKLFPETSKFSRLVTVAKEKELFGHDSDIYEGLDSIRIMRDKIHLHLAEFSHQTDYKYFNSDKYIETKIVLLRFLSLYFNISSDEIHKYFSYLHPISSDEK